MTKHEAFRRLAQEKISYMLDKVYEGDMLDIYDLESCWEACFIGTRYYPLMVGSLLDNYKVLYKDIKEQVENKYISVNKKELKYVEKSINKMKKDFMRLKMYKCEDISIDNIKFLLNGDEMPKEIKQELIKRKLKET